MNKENNIKIMNNRYLLISLGVLLLILSLFLGIYLAIYWDEGVDYFDRFQLSPIQEGKSSSRDQSEYLTLDSLQESGFALKYASGRLLYVNVNKVNVEHLELLGDLLGKIKNKDFPPVITSYELVEADLFVFSVVIPNSNHILKSGVDGVKYTYIGIQKDDQWRVYDENEMTISEKNMISNPWLERINAWNSNSSVKTLVGIENNQSLINKSRILPFRNIPKVFVVKQDFEYGAELSGACKDSKDDMWYCNEVVFGVSEKIMSGIDVMNENASSFEVVSPIDGYVNYTCGVGTNNGAVYIKDYKDGEVHGFSNIDLTQIAREKIKIGSQISIGTLIGNTRNKNVASSSSVCGYNTSNYLRWIVSKDQSLYSVKDSLSDNVMRLTLPEIIDSTNLQHEDNFPFKYVPIL